MFCVPGLRIIPAQPLLGALETQREGDDHEHASKPCRIRHKRLNQVDDDVRLCELDERRPGVREMRRENAVDRRFREAKREQEARANIEAEAVASDERGDYRHDAGMD